MARPPEQNQDDQYSEQEAQQRFRTLVGIALKSLPKPIKKSMGKKGVPAQSKKWQKRVVVKRQAIG